MFVIAMIRLILLATDTDGLFVSVGNYSDSTIPGLNLPECGLGYVPKQLDVSFGTKCFSDGYQKKTIQIIDSQDLMDSVSNRIWGGSDASIGDAPWTVHLHINGGKTCTGVLITFEWVMTAAHCIDAIETTTTVYAGSVRRFGSRSKVVNRQKMIRHPFYVNPEHANSKDPVSTKIIHDIGLVKLHGKFQPHLNDSRHYLINPICLPKKDQWNDKLESATITGYGVIDQAKTSAEILQEGTVSLSKPRFCAYKNMFCAYANPEQTRVCSGDSGGPLYQFDHLDLKRAILVGIGVGTEPNCTLGTRGRSYWSAPTHFISWILETMVAE